METATHDSMRNHPQLAALFIAAESRHLTEEELGQYESVFPEYRSRATSAREIAKHETYISGKVAKLVTEAYGYDRFHDLSTKKCFRDIGLVTCYASLSMLMGDPKWFEDKLLIWFKTILHSFRFPDMQAAQQPLIDNPQHIEKLAKLQPFQKSVFETYALLYQEMKSKLSGAAFEEIEPYLALSRDILSND